MIKKQQKQQKQKKQQNTWKFISVITAMYFSKTISW